MQQKLVFLVTAKYVVISTIHCYICQKKSQQSPKASNQSPPTNIDIAPVNVTAVSSASAEDQKNVIIATARVTIKAANGMSGE